MEPMSGKQLGPALIEQLIQEARMASPDEVARIAGAVLASGGCRDVVVLVVDYAQRLLVPLPPDAGPPLDIDTTRSGEAYRTMQPGSSALPGGRERLHLPLVDGVERLGVLEATVPPGTADDDAAVATLVAFASCLAELITTKGQYGDAFARAARSRPMSLAAEMQWQTLPPLTFATDGVVVAGSLEPSYAVGGDMFDYGVETSCLRFAVMDAMGHGLQASLLATAAVGAYRNARRSVESLEDCVRHMDAAVAEAFPGGSYVTAVVAELDLRDGVVRWVLAGHPPPLVLHDGRVERFLSVPAVPPLGLLGISDDSPLTVGTTQLRPGDGILAYTDGVVDARDPEGTFFGVDRLAELVGSVAITDVPTPEVLRQVTLQVLEHQSGEIQDDATQLFIEWRSGREERLSPLP
jgi:hypothetical protein